MLGISQIVPELPPEISGVGDYAYLLARELKRTHEIKTRFILCNSLAGEKADIEDFEVLPVQAHDTEALEKHLNAFESPKVAVLHYVGYGYQKRGCPVWLLRGLESWKRRDKRHRLVVMFHELYACGPPWRSSFWLSALQRRLTRSLAVLADHCITNLTSRVQFLRSMTGHPETNFSLLPVFSNVGEMSLVPRLSSRKPRMVVFGSAAWRRQAYIDHCEDLERACRELHLTEIVDIGPPCGATPKLAVPSLIKGSLLAEEVSLELVDAQAGFFAYPVPYLGKSGVFAAYAAHGLVPITYDTNVAENKDGLHTGDHFVAMSSKYRCDLDRIKTISRKAHSWYCGHSLSEQAAVYGKVIHRLAWQSKRRNQGCGEGLQERQ